MTSGPVERDNGGLHSRIMTDIEGKPASHFDFGRLQEMPGDDLGAIRALHETFVRNLCSSLTIPLRASVSGEVLSVDQTSYGAFTDALHAPTTLAFFETPACEVPCVLEVSPELVFPILDLLLGGSGRSATNRVRELTDVEKDLLEKPLAIFARELTRAWRAFVQCDFAPASIRTSPRLAGPVGRSESMAAIGMRVTVAEAGGSLRLLVPAPLARLVRRDSAAPPREPRATNVECERAIRQQLNRRLLVDVDCELRGSSIRLKDLLGLQVGTVVDLGIVCDGAITICVNGSPKFNGWLTQAGPRMAVAVE